MVGAGNSGAQIPDELARERDVTLAVGKRPPTLPQRLLSRDIFWWLHRLGLMRVPATSLLGQRMRRLDPLLDSNPGRLARERGVRLVGRALSACGSARLGGVGDDAAFLGAQIAAHLARTEAGAALAPAV